MTPGRKFRQEVEPGKVCWHARVIVYKTASQASLICLWWHLIFPLIEDDIGSWNNKQAWRCLLSTRGWFFWNYLLRLEIELTVKWLNVFLFSSKYLLLLPPSTKHVAQIARANIFPLLEFVTRILYPLNAIAMQKGSCETFHWNRTLRYLLTTFEGELMQASCGTRTAVSQLTLFRCFLEFHFRIVKLVFVTLFWAISLHVSLYWTWTQFA